MLQVGCRPFPPRQPPKITKRRNRLVIFILSFFVLVFVQCAVVQQAHYSSLFSQVTTLDALAFIYLFFTYMQISCCHPLPPSLPSPSAPLRTFMFGPMRAFCIQVVPCGLAYFQYDNQKGRLFDALSYFLFFFMQRPGDLSLVFSLPWIQVPTKHNAYTSFAHLASSQQTKGGTGLCTRRLSLFFVFFFGAVIRQGWASATRNTSSRNRCPDDQPFVSSSPLETSDSTSTSYVVDSPKAPPTKSTDSDNADVPLLTPFPTH